MTVRTNRNLRSSADADLSNGFLVRFEGRLDFVAQSFASLKFELFLQKAQWKQLRPGAGANSAADCIARVLLRCDMSVNI